MSDEIIVPPDEVELRKRSVRDSWDEQTERRRAGVDSGRFERGVKLYRMVRGRQGWVRSIEYVGYL
jgi:hypothetical protein